MAKKKSITETVTFSIMAIYDGFSFVINKTLKHSAFVILCKIGLLRQLSP